MSKKKWEEETLDGPVIFYYTCRRCDRKIEAEIPGNMSPAEAVEVKKNTYEFECKDDEGCKV